MFDGVPYRVVRLRRPRTEIVAAATRIVEAWNDPEVWESDDLYDRIRELAALMKRATPTASKEGR
jgi:hypothetical protein